MRRAAAEQRLTEPGRAMGHGKRATAQARQTGRLTHTLGARESKRDTEGGEEHGRRERTRKEGMDPEGGEGHGRREWTRKEKRNTEGREGAHGRTGGSTAPMGGRTVADG